MTNAGNWQEHSFDSSIVTEGHYDASFESEVLPIGPVHHSNHQQSVAMQSSMTSVDLSAVTAAPSTSMVSSGGPNNLTHSASMKNRPRPPPLAHSAKKSVFSLSGLSDQNTVVAASSGLGLKCMGDGPTHHGIKTLQPPPAAGGLRQHTTTASTSVSGPSVHQSGPGGPNQTKPRYYKFEFPWQNF